jgi:pimeloyl-ACP methyl ester carboxylesterase
MPSTLFEPTRRVVLAAAAVGASSALQSVARASSDYFAADVIRPFRIEIPEDALVDLRGRIGGTRWPERETVADHQPNALPLIVTHGWPGSIIEQLKIVGPLIDPTAHRGSASDAFDLVIPSLPGYGFSGKPTKTGWDPIRVALAWIAVMKRLGYSQFVAQGGGWGNAVTEQMALLAPPELLGIHANMPAAVPADVERALHSSEPAPSGLSEDERGAYDQLDFSYKHGLGYAQEMANRPQTLYAIAYSPVGLAAWMLDHDARSHTVIARVFDGQREGLTKDGILDNVTLYSLTNTAVSSARLYWESKLPFFEPKHVAVPVAVSAFPDDFIRPREVGRSGPIPNSSTTTDSTKADTSPPGSSLSSLWPSFKPDFGRWAPRRADPLDPRGAPNAFTRIVIDIGKV